MRKLAENIKAYWYIYIVSILLGIQLLVFLIFRGESYIQIHDNLDLFIPHYRMISLNHAWFAQNATMPMLHGIDRNLLGSEFLLYNILYIIFPPLVAYFLGYALKIFIGIFSFRLLARDVLGEAYPKYKALVILSAAAYGMIPVFPTYGIAFTSIPLIVYLLRRLYIEDGFKALAANKTLIRRRILLYIGVFAYPVLSYFSYHGIFILGYMVLALIILWIKDKKLPGSLLASVCILSAGYICFEYRLFKAMLFDDTVTIRSSMVRANSTLAEALKAAGGEFVKASFHSQDSHNYLIFGLTILAVIVINYLYVKNHEAGRILTDPINLILLWIMFNCLIFGLCDFAPFRNLLETLLPPLKGFEFSRTSFFNPFLWYVELLLICIRLYDNKKKIFKGMASGLACLALLIVMLAPAVYNDFYYTCYNQAFKLIKHKETSTLNYNEFYSSELFETIKADMGYDGEWSAAYGLHPGVLVYNGIASLDGYLGMYSEEYKQKWIALEAPAFAGSPSLKEYYENWGARVSLYSGADENTYAPVRELELNDRRLMVNIDELKSLDCAFVFSRIEFTNADELGIKLIKEYKSEQSPYSIYVYDLR